MRQIKFRGKRVDNGKWVYGNLVNCSDCIYIVYEAFADDYRWGFENVFIPIDHATVGQFTGLIDKNGKEIWEGDIVTELFGTKGIILFKHCSFMIEWKADVYSELLGWKNFIRGVISDGKELEVISNIHDNPSLLTNK